MYQTIIVVGNLGRDPEMRYTPNGQAVTNFSVATNRNYTTSDGNQVKETTWFRITTWGKNAENCNQYLKKGSRVLVEGRLNPDSETGGPRIWEGKSGPRASFEVTANIVRFLTSRSEAEGDYQVSESTDSDSDDEIPF